MAEEMIVGLFEALGSAEDARNRLHYEGVPEGDIELHVLKQTEPMPPGMAALHDAPIDPFFGTSVHQRYLQLIHNGETAVCVRVHSEEEAETAINTLRQFAPIELDRLEPGEEGEVWREKAIAGDRR